MHSNKTTFKEFLSEASRTQVTDVESFIKWADKNAKAYMNGSHFLYRGGSGDIHKGLRLGNSAGADVTPRTSANTYNNYTLWFDNNYLFAGWPKRSLSWIGSDDREVADNFGGAALLIIDDSAKIGIVGEEDLWYVELGIGLTMEEINAITQGLINVKSKTYEDLEAALKKYTIDELHIELENTDREDQKLVDIFDYMENKKFDNLYDLWEDLVRPEIFAGKTTGAKVGKAGGEVWIEGTVGFIPHVTRLSESDANRLTEWAEQYPELLDEIHEHWSNDSYD